MVTSQLRLTRIVPLSPWLPVCAGLLAAELAAALVCQLPNPLNNTPPRLLLRTAAYLALTAAAGYGGIALPRHLTRRPYPLPAGTLARLSLPGWLFLPAIVLFYRQHSIWILPAVALASTLLTLNLARLTFLERTPARRAGEASPGFLPSLFGLPGPEYHPAIKFLVASSAAATALLTANGFWAFAGLCLAAAGVLATSRWITLTAAMPHRRPSPARARTQLTASATLLTFFALALWTLRAGSPHGPGTPDHHAPPPPTGAPEGSGSGYLGVILLPPPVDRKDIAPPAPRSPISLRAGLSRPLAIPFDGPYWYFKAPHTRPGSGAHVVHGKSTEVNVRSSDFAPLLMEARQTLSTPIDSSCCSAIDLALTNADNRPGRIIVELLLTDTVAPSHPSLSLGEVPIQSSDILQIVPHRPPINESLHFPIPHGTGPLHFNEIAVIFHPDSTRARTGARVAIQNFLLIPR